jgi:hypothetical protein
MGMICCFLASFLPSFTFLPPFLSSFLPSFLPSSNNNTLYLSLSLGSVMLATIFGNVSMYIANFSANTTAYQRKMEYLFESMNLLDLPQTLKSRIILYYDHIWKHYRSLDGRVHGFIPELSKQLG